MKDPNFRTIVSDCGDWHQDQQNRNGKWVNVGNPTPAPRGADTDYDIHEASLHETFQDFGRGWISADEENALLPKALQVLSR